MFLRQIQDFISLEIFTGKRERRKLSIIRELCDYSIARLLIRLPFSAVFFRWLFSTFASRVANAPRKLRYHQLCSPASLSTEWTQSGSLFSESSFRWSLSYMHSLTDRIMTYNRHAASKYCISLSRISDYLNIECRTLCLPNAPNMPSYRSSLISSRITSSVARDLGINSSMATRMEIIKCLLLKWKEFCLYFSTFWWIIFMRHFLTNLYSCLA